MLKLVNITKDYYAGGEAVHALRGVSVEFRKSEFVSILGPSGCGKTTLLNIIGGLDRYTSGDLVFDDVSTKKYTDRDWDVYRNHRIGFVFQSYNLIPHQTVLENVELALTIGGVGRAERVRRAKEALDKVGLQGLYSKKPNQLSGGQCQRVAIARALVNEPEILLADEPTGALDTATSVQTMELIRELSETKLVIMVTHNPELAEQYSTRIIRLLDGLVTDDTDPYDGVDTLESGAGTTFLGRADGSREREGDRDTGTTSATVATGTTGAEESADEGAEEALKREANGKESGAPRTNRKASGAHGTDGKESGATDVGSGKKSEAKAVRKRNSAKLSFWSAFRLSARNLRSKLKRTVMVCIAGSIGIIGVASVLAVSTGVQNYIEAMQNDMLSGNPITVSEEAFDMAAIMDSMNGSDRVQAVEKAVKDGYINVDDMISYLVSRSEGLSSYLIHNDITDDYVDFIKEMPSEYYSALVFDYGLDVGNNIYTDYAFETTEGEDRVFMSINAAQQVFSSLVSETEAENFSSYLSALGNSFSQAPDNGDFILSQYDIISDAASSKIATEADEIMIVVSDDATLTDLLLARLGYYTQAEFLNRIYKATGSDKYDEALDKEDFSYDELLGKTFVWYPNDAVFNETGSALNPFTYNPYSSEEWEGRTLKVTAILRPKEGLNYGCLSSGFYYTAAFSRAFLDSAAASAIVRHLTENETETFTSFSINGVDAGITYKYSYVYEGTERTDVTGFVGSMNSMGMLGMTGATTYTLTLRELGGNGKPETISVYPTDFTYKDRVTEYLSLWNSGESLTVNGSVLTADARAEIEYTDNMAIVISLVNGMINMVTYALIAFTALSLVVSTVMIAIITYVSVIERVKEIGVIRSLGGRKHDVSRLFNAETFIIGGVAGIIGVAVTYALSAIINLIVGGLTGIYTIATLPASTALIMIAVSIALTLISGLIPARLAAKKDPAVALRSE